MQRLVNMSCTETGNLLTCPLCPRTDCRISKCYKRSALQHCQQKPHFKGSNSATIQQGTVLLQHSMGVSGSMHQTEARKAGLPHPATGLVAAIQMLGVATNAGSRHKGWAGNWINTCQRPDRCARPRQGQHVTTLSQGCKATTGCLPGDRHNWYAVACVYNPTPPVSISLACHESQASVQEQW